MADKDQSAETTTGDAGSNATPPSPPPPPSEAPESPRIKTDIEKILKGIKLPERRGEVPKKPIQATPLTVPEVLSSPEMTKPAHEETSPVVALHTLKDDLQNVVKDQHLSVVRAVSMEQDKKALSPRVDESAGKIQRNKRIFGILFASGVLVVLGLAALLGVFLVMQGNRPSATPQYASLVFAEQTYTLPVNGVSPSDLKRQIALAENSGTGALGSITRLIPVVTSNPVDTNPQTRQGTAAEFLLSLGVHAPDGLLHALQGDVFFGIHTVDKNAPVIVMPITAYDHAFAGMLAWESTMDADLAPIFPAVSPFSTDANGIPQARLFTDLVMRNYDARALKDDAGNIVLYYSFPTPDLLVIGQSPYTFTEILSRLQSARRL